MPKPKLQPDPEEVLELEDFQDDTDYDDYEENAWQRSPLWLRVIGTTLALAVILAASFEFVYAGKIYPGVTADGVYVGGLSKGAASKKLADKLSSFTGEVITISTGDSNLRIPVASLGVKYDPDKVIDLAHSYGRQGGLWAQAKQQARALLGRSAAFSSYTYANDQLVPFLVDLDADTSTPVQNASLSFDDNHAQVTPAQPGTRLNLGRLGQLVADRIANTSTDTINATFSGTDRLIDQKTIISWIEVGSKPRHNFLQTLKLEDAYPLPPAASLGLSRAAVQAYVADLAGGIDQTPQNAVLSMDSGQLSITQASRNGVKVDQAAAVSAITDSLKRPADDRHVDLKLNTATAEVNENNLASLGIKELISEGTTYFPGSPSTRITNIRVGAKRFDQVLLKPGETFSFGKILGDVGPAQGYVPELVILGDHEEKQYGGGLCQVASTAYRAALLAGLPIVERHNHSFAVSYYTAPYSAPGVDATIYYPEVDFKFTNDTPSYILIQTTLQGTTLKFDYFGTKTKTGVIRGPEFVTGTNDATKPSHTVFYRDILDLAGNVTKTDTVNTYYKPSTDFPITKQFN
jgi:vancomycin resistance protein YoaR